MRFLPKQINFNIPYCDDLTGPFFGSLDLFPLIVQAVRAQGGKKFLLSISMQILVPICPNGQNTKG